MPARHSSSLAFKVIGGLQGPDLASVNGLETVNDRSVLVAVQARSAISRH
jgi:hypothetical protein